MGIVSYVLLAGYCIYTLELLFWNIIYAILPSQSIQLMGVVIENAPLISF